MFVLRTKAITAECNRMEAEMKFRLVIEYTTDDLPDSATAEERRVWINRELDCWRSGEVTIDDVLSIGEKVEYKLIEGKDEKDS